MGTEIVTLENTKLPAYLQAGAASSVVTENALAGMGSGTSHPRISCKAARFRIIEDGTEQILNTLSLSAVVVGANPCVSKIYFDGAYDPEDPKSPECFSEDGVGPDASASKPQNNLCASCPKNAWGSKITPQGTETKACGDLKRLAVVSVDDVGGTVYELVVTPAAFGSWRDHVKKLQMRNVPIEAAITNLSFDPTASFPKLQFAFGGFLSDEDYQTARKVALGDSIKEITRQKAGGRTLATKVEHPKALTPAPTPPVAPTPAPAPAAPVATGFGKKKKPAAPAPAAPAEAPPAVSMDDLEKELAAFAASDD